MNIYSAQLLNTDRDSGCDQQLADDHQKLWHSPAN